MKDIRARSVIFLASLVPFYIFGLLPVQRRETRDLIVDRIPEIIA